MPERLQNREVSPEEAAEILAARPTTLHLFLATYREERPAYHTEYQTAVYRALVARRAA